MKAGDKLICVDDGGRKLIRRGQHYVAKIVTSKYVTVEGGDGSEYYHQRFRVVSEGQDLRVLL